MGWEKSKWNNSYLIEFGRVGLVKIKTKITGKLDDEAEAMIMVGYGNEYSVGTYKFYNPKSKRFVSHVVNLRGGKFILPWMVFIFGLRT